MCMADDSFGRRIPFAFLQDMKDKFLSSYGRERAIQAPPYGLNEFSRVMAKQMVKFCCCVILFLMTYDPTFSQEYFSSNPNSDRLKQVHGEIEQVKDVMVHNIGI